MTTNNSQLDEFLNEALEAGSTPVQEPSTEGEQSVEQQSELTPEQEIEQIRAQITELSQERDRTQQILEAQRQQLEREQQERAAQTLLNNMRSYAEQKYTQLTQTYGMNEQAARQEAIEYAKLAGGAEYRMMMQQRTSRMAQDIAQEFGVDAQEVAKGRDESDMRDRAQLLQRLSRLENGVQSVQTTQNINSRLSSPRGSSDVPDNVFLRQARNQEIDMRDPDNMKRLREVMQRVTGQTYPGGA